MMQTEKTRHNGNQRAGAMYIEAKAVIIQTHALATGHMQVCTCPTLQAGALAYSLFGLTARPATAPRARAWRSHGAPPR